MKFEALLQRVTDRVRDSLDESHILQSAVQELAIALELSACNGVLYSAKQEISQQIAWDVSHQLVPAVVGQRMWMDGLAHISHQFPHRQFVQFCLTPQPAISPRQLEGQFAILYCPLMDNQEVIGDLWLLRPRQDSFDELEVMIVQKVASQCAIALRQARLYQTVYQQAEELDHLKRLRDDFLNTLSHELRTPMASVKLVTDLLEISLMRQGILDTEPDIAQYLKILREQGQREIDLINDLLDLSQLDAKVDSLMLAPIDLSIWVPHLVESFLQRLQKQQQRLHLDLAPNLPVVTTDLCDLERVLTELLDNACKYTPDGETITLSTQVVAPSSLCLSVCNTGIEIPAKECDRIFDTFYRIPNPDPWKHSGTGLGLALVKKIMKRLGGTVQVESSNGQTTFTICLPLDSSTYPPVHP